ncbi:hypothetical protein Xmau_03396 [Xenorhabdus mauleonii]|uniref:Uncharacterized protein n=1 Tax=Xenorhabdus mauleonii TaxID=351675 RepID=A0A1I3QX09_9GAMM|nr:hypothetical protein Xmau_03396 [Xenorhabdus mauleonii]SFJ38618.1 hypothetical protein SAMN05421680_10863 [Xenorhabdus mauleonii]
MPLNFKMQHDGKGARPRSIDMYMTEVSEANKAET